MSVKENIAWPRQRTDSMLPDCAHTEPEAGCGIDYAIFVHVTAPIIAFWLNDVSSGQTRLPGAQLRRYILGTQVLLKAVASTILGAFF